MSEEEKKSARHKVSDGIKQGIGVLSAFKDALEETIQEARERGDLSTERAKEVMRGALDKAQSAAEGAKDRLDLVHQTEFDELKEVVDAIKARVAAIEERFSVGADEEEEDSEAGDAASE